MTTIPTPRPRPAPAGIAWPGLLWIAGLHAGALLAFVPGYFSWPALAVCLALHWLTGSLGVCMTYHRLLTHRSFAVRRRWLEYPLTALGCCASEDGAIRWVAGHRRHHAHADGEHDVHSPRRGLAWAHLLRWVNPDLSPARTPDYYARWAPDLARDPVHVRLDRWHFAFPALLFVALFAAGGVPVRCLKTGARRGRVAAARPTGRDGRAVSRGRPSAGPVGHRFGGSRNSRSRA